MLQRCYENRCSEHFNYRIIDDDVKFVNDRDRSIADNDQFGSICAHYFHYYPNPGRVQHE